jgi:hypothetical protein
LRNMCARVGGIRVRPVLMLSLVCGPCVDLLHDAGLAEPVAVVDSKPSVHPYLCDGISSSLTIS